MSEDPHLVHKAIYLLICFSRGKALKYQLNGGWFSIMSAEALIKVLADGLEVKEEEWEHENRMS